MLTAFLIESYKNLSVNETESLLRQMVFQTANYRFNNGYLNTTFDPSLLPAFQTATSDIRVNVCWFASLLLSLSSASFGILVKQWLREFLAIDPIGPQDRIRIRDARIRGVADWKLFQIATFLPVLLQISLVLFFVGLCFFTAAVHPSIGNTTLFLVSSWAFLSSISILAPLVSPRCTYKMTLFKPLSRLTRPHLHSSISFVHQRCAALLLRLGGKIPTWGDNTAVASESERTLWTDSERLQHYDDCMDLEILNKFSHFIFPKDTVPEEEDIIRSTEGNDLTVFCNLDAAFLDDDLLESMQKACSQRIPPPPLRHMLQFVTTIVQHRLGIPLSLFQSFGSRDPWPWTLPQRVRVVLVNMLAKSMKYELHRRSSFDRQWVDREASEWGGSLTFLISLVSPPKPVPASVIDLFTEAIGLRQQQQGHDFIDIFALQMRSLARSSPEWPERSLLFLAQSLKTVKAENAADFLQQVVHKSFVELERAEHPGMWATYDHLLMLTECGPFDDNGDVIAPTPQRIIGLLEVARVILHNYVLEQSQDQDEFPPEIRILLEFVLEAIPGVKKFHPEVNFREPRTPASDGLGFYQVLTELFTTSRTTGPTLHFFATNPQFLFAPSQSDVRFFVYLVREVEHQSRE